MFRAFSGIPVLSPAYSCGEQGTLVPPSSTMSRIPLKVAVFLGTELFGNKPQEMGTICKVIGPEQNRSAHQCPRLELLTRTALWRPPGCKLAALPRQQLSLDILAFSVTMKPRCKRPRVPSSRASEPGPQCDRTSSTTLQPLNLCLPVRGPLVQLHFLYCSGIP